VIVASGRCYFRGLSFLAERGPFCVLAVELQMSVAAVFCVSRLQKRRSAHDTIVPMDEPRPRGTAIGRQVSGPLLIEAEHFKRCPLCHGYVDMRDRVWLEEHQ